MLLGMYSGDLGFSVSIPNFIRVAESDTYRERERERKKKREREMFITIVYTQLCMTVVDAEYIHFLFPSF